MSDMHSPTFEIGAPEAAKLAWIGVTPRQLFGFLAMVFGMFMAILDIQIVSASLAEIQAGLSASADEISWVQTAYLIAEVVMIPFRASWLGCFQRACCSQPRRPVSRWRAHSAPRPPPSIR